MKGGAILRYGNPLLRKRSAAIEVIDREIVELAEKMVSIMDGAKGVGLAAIQIGVPLRLFVLRRYIESNGGTFSLSKESYVYINPKIICHSKEEEIAEEGCLSIPQIFLPVRRPCSVQVSSTRLDGSEQVEELRGMNGRVIFHENDHLNGVLFIDRVDSSLLLPFEEALHRIKKSS